MNSNAGEMKGHCLNKSSALNHPEIQLKLGLNISLACKTVLEKIIQFAKSSPVKLNLASSSRHHSTVHA